jgi:hypothetical protein
MNVVSTPYAGSKKVQHPEILEMTCLIDLWGGGGFSGMLLDVRELQNKNKAGAVFFVNGGLFLFSCANACQMIDDGLLVETEGLGQGSAPEPDLIVRKVQIFQCVTNLFTTLEKVQRRSGG